MVNIFKILLFYPTSFLTLYLISCMKDNLPHIELIKYTQNKFKNKKTQNAFNDRKMQISKSNKYIIAVLTFCLLNLYLVLKGFISDITTLHNNSVICEINNEFKELSKPNDDFSKTIENECTKINEHPKDIDRCRSCKSNGKINRTYKCQMRDVSGQSSQSRSIPIDFNEQPDVCNHYNTVVSDEESTENYLIKHFFVLFLSCLCLTLLNINNTIQETLINVGSYIILYLLVIMSKNYLNENISVAIIVLGIFVLFNISYAILSHKFINLKKYYFSINLLFIGIFSYLNYKNYKFNERNNITNDIKYDSISVIIMLVYQMIIAYLIQNNS